MLLPFEAKFVTVKFTVIRLKQTVGDWVPINKLQPFNFKSKVGVKMNWTSSEKRTDVGDFLGDIGVDKPPIPRGKFTRWTRSI